MTSNHNKIAADEFCNKTHTSPIEAYVANRIYELETQVNRLKQERDTLRAQRDEARREACGHGETIGGALLEAELRGWDCFKQEDGK